MKKKIIALTLCLAMFAVGAIGSTLAYFTDTDEEVNVFTIGNVKIDLIESQYHRVNAGRTDKTVAEEPLSGGYIWAGDVTMEGTPENTPNKDTGGEGWTKAYFSDEQIEEDAETYKEGYFAEKSVNMVPGRNIRKNPYVKNIGSNPAYIRVRALIPVDLFEIIDNGPTYWTSTAMNDGEVVSEAVNTYNTSGFAAVPTVTRGDIEYYVYDFTYVDPVEPGDLTFWNVWGNIAINKNATAEDLANVESFDIIFQADAIQSEGFANYEEAFTAFDAAQAG